LNDTLTGLNSSNWQEGLHRKANPFLRGVPVGGGGGTDLKRSNAKGKKELGVKEIVGF